MLKRGTGKRLWLALAIAALGVMAYAGLALAASPPIVGQVDDTYSASTYTIDQGEVAQLQVTGSTHNATARQDGPDSRALFRSPTISGGTTGVDGTQYLAAGDYTFFCTIHPTTMLATLHVTANGMPQARPSSSIKVTRRRVSQTIKKGLKVKMTPTTAIQGVTLTAKLGKTTIGKKSTSLGPGFNSPVVKLSKTGKSRLRGKSSAKVSVTADIPFGSPVTSKVKLG